MIHFFYEVRMINRKGEDVCIFGPSRSMRTAWKVANKQNPRRRIKIYRDNKLLAGGRSALDGHVYARWLQESAC